MTNGVEKKEDSQQVNYEEQLNKINGKVADLVGANKENNDGAEQELGTLLNTEFLTGLNSYFAENPEKKEEFKNNVKQLVEKFEKENGGKVPDELRPLLDFVKDIGVELKDNSEVDNLKQPKLELTGSLGKIGKVTINEGDPQNKKGAQKFFSKINLKNGKEEVSRLDETINNISSLLTSVSAINLEDSYIPEEIKNNINNIKNLLASVQDVINNTTPENVKTLQKYIFENIEDKELFKKKNTYDETKKEFDGKFGENTLDGLNSVLRKISEYTKNLPDYLSKLKEDASKKENEEKEENEEKNRIEAEKQQKVKDVIEGLELTVVDVDAEARKNYKLPENGDIYEREGNQGYYYIENNEYVVYVPLEKSYRTMVLKISEYKKGTEYNDEPRKYKTDSNTENTGNATNNGNETGTESENGTVDINTLIGTIKAQLGLHPAGGIDRASFGLPSNGVIYMGYGEFYYYITPENNKLIRVSPKGGRGYLDLNQYNKNHKIDWVSEDLGYPEISDENRERYEKILNESLKGIGRLNKYNWSISIGYDSLHKRHEYKILSKNKSLSTDVYSNFIDADMLTTGWVFEGKDHLKKDLRVYCLVRDLVSKYRNIMKNCRFDLVNNQLIRIDKFGNKEVIIDSREWNKYYGNNGELAGNNARRFCNYLNRCSGGIYYVEEQPATTSSGKPGTAEQSTSIPQGNKISGDAMLISSLTGIPGVYIDKLAEGVPEGNEFDQSGEKQVPEQSDQSGEKQVPEQSDQSGEKQVPEQSDQSGEKQVTIPEIFDLSKISAEMPEKFSNPKEIKNTCFDDVIRNSDDLSGRFQILISEIFNIAVGNVNTLDDSDEKKQKIQVLNLFKEGFIKPDEYCIEKGLKCINTRNLKSPDKFEISSFRGFLHYFEIDLSESKYSKLSDEYSKLQSDIASESKEISRQEANNLVKELCNKLPNQIDRDNLSMRCESNQFVDRYAEGNRRDQCLLKLDLEKFFKYMVKHCEWRGRGDNSSAATGILYQYEGTGLNYALNIRPIGKGKVTFCMPGSHIEESFIGNWDEKSRLTSCESYGESIKIEHDSLLGTYFENAKGKLKIDSKGEADIGMIANKINYMVSKVRNNGKINNVTIRFGKLFVIFDNGKVMNLKDKVRETMYIDDSMTDLEITNWFHNYFNEKLSNNQ